MNLKIADLYDLSHTKAADYLKGFEYPWEALAETFAEGTTHEGTITEKMEKGAVVHLAEGVEGFATPKHLQKEDGSVAEKGETLAFKVIEFNKDSRRIILSHSRIFEDAAKAAARREQQAKRKDKKAAAENAEAPVQMPIEKTTLGDIDALAALRDKLAGK